MESFTDKYTEVLKSTVTNRIADIGLESIAQCIGRGDYIFCDNEKITINKNDLYSFVFCIARNIPTPVITMTMDMNNSIYVIRKNPKLAMLIFVYFYGIEFEGDILEILNPNKFIEECMQNVLNEVYTDKQKLLFEYNNKVSDLAYNSLNDDTRKIIRRRSFNLQLIQCSDKDYEIYDKIFMLHDSLI